MVNRNSSLPWRGNTSRPRVGNSVPRGNTWPSSTGARPGTFQQGLPQGQPRITYTSAPRLNVGSRILGILGAIPLAAEAGRGIGNILGSTYYTADRVRREGLGSFWSAHNSSFYAQHGWNSQTAAAERRMRRHFRNNEPAIPPDSVRAGELIQLVGGAEGGIYDIAVEFRGNATPSFPWIAAGGTVKGALGELRVRYVPPNTYTVEVLARRPWEALSTPRSWINLGSGQYHSSTTDRNPLLRNAVITPRGDYEEPVIEQPYTLGNPQVAPPIALDPERAAMPALIAALGVANANSNAQQTSALTDAITAAQNDIGTQIQEQGGELAEANRDALDEKIPCDLCQRVDDIDTSVSNVGDSVNTTYERVGDVINTINQGFQDIGIAEILRRVVNIERELETPITITQQVHQCQAEDGEEAPPPPEPKTVTAKPFQAIATAFGHNADVTNKAHEEVCDLEFEPELVVPQDWETRVGPNRPQLVIAWRSIDGQGNLGRQWSTAVPHYVHEEGWKPPEWRKGSSWCRARLKDNSHIIVYAHTQGAARAVVEALLARVNENQKPAQLGTGDILSGEFEEVDVVPYFGDFFPSGRGNGKAENRYYYR